MAHSMSVSIEKPRLAPQGSELILLPTGSPAGKLTGSTVLRYRYLWTPLLPVLFRTPRGDIL
jgi:hypothetical protein